MPWRDKGLGGPRRGLPRSAFRSSEGRHIIVEGLEPSSVQHSAPLWAARGLPRPGALTLSQAIHARPSRPEALKRWRPGARQGLPCCAVVAHNVSFLVPRHHLKCQKKRLSAKCILFSAFYFSWLGFTCEFFFNCVDKICVASFSQNCTNVFPIPLCAQKCYSWPVLKTRTNDFYFKDIVPIKFADESLLEKEIIDDGQIHCCVAFLLCTVLFLWFTCLGLGMQSAGQFFCKA